MPGNRNSDTHRDLPALTYEPVWPTQRSKIILARLLRSKLLAKLHDSLRIFLHRVQLG